MVPPKPSAVRRSPRSAALPVLLLCPVAVLVAGLGSIRPYEPVPVAATYEMARRTAAVAPLVAPALAQGDVTTEAAERVGPGRQALAYWSTEATSPDGATSAHMVWRGSAHELVSVIVSRRASAVSTADRPRLTKAGAVAASWGWMRALGLADQAPRWTLARDRGTDGGGRSGWYIAWRAQDRWAVTVLDPRDGALSSAYTSRLFAFGHHRL